MSNPRPQLTQAQEEAAEWLARLGDYPISTQTVRAFRDWRDDPVNDAAYQEAEAFWEASGRTAGDPEILRMTEQALRRRRRKLHDYISLPPVRLTLALAALALFSLGVLATHRLFPSYATRSGELRMVSLPDGSRLHLNMDSRVKVRFSDGQRRLILTRGQAFFDVAHDPSRPFLVEANGARVRALGTKFDVRRRRDGVQVTLLEGRVQVRQAERSEAWTLAPNQQLVLSEATRTPRPQPADAARSTSWTTGELRFEATPLAEAVAEVNRYGALKVALQGADLPQRRISGHFDVGDTTAFAHGVALALNLEATPARNGVITLRPRRGGGA